MTIHRQLRLFALIVLSLLVGCSDGRPTDGESAISVHGVLADVPRREGYVTPPQTGVQLWYDRVGERNHGTVVLINGSDANAAMWSDDFVLPFVEAGYQVVRYDARDNGRSEWLDWPEDFEVEGWTPDSGPIYPITAHVDDLVGLLDGLSIDRAHLIGLSMGGMVAQLMALNHPERVGSLVLLSTSPSNSFDPELEPADPAYFEELATGWRAMGVRASFQAIVDQPLVAAMTDTFLLFTYQPSADDADEMRRLVERLLEHAPHNPLSAQGFAVAALQPWVDRLNEISAPTLVIHGEYDRLFPHKHGEVLAREIPGARLISVKDLGHGLPISHFLPYVDAMLQTLRLQP